ncbi:Coatomer_beta subunit [Hexamita inflata]|uniref:Coatomer beta subunit n=1 Tax=Hexamita inflata TaxID=28002 RepID=A0AA86UB94_9EUKA|nr:Coatomer beta subunit [Hexamita inflata]
MSDGCHILISSNVEPLSSKTLDSVFERTGELEMISTMKSIFQQMCNGEDVDAYIIPIIKNVSTSQCKQLKKILHMFWPMVDCYYANGTLKPHMILICNSILQDLNYPNEYIICSALRCVMNFQAKEVVQHLTLAIPPLLLHANEEVRATAAIALRTINSKFMNLVSPRKLEEQLLLEKNPSVLRQIIISLSQVSLEYFQENIQSAVEGLKYIDDQYEIGMGIFEVFEKLPASFQASLVQKLKLFDQLPGQIYYQAGRALIKYFKQNAELDSGYLILAAQCLLISCKEASSSSILQIIDLISKMELQNIPNSSQVAQTLAHVFTAQQNEEIQFKLFQRRLFQKICASDSNSSKQIVDSLTSSRIIETTNIELYYELLNTVFEVAEASEGFAEITVAGIQELCSVCLQLVEYTSSNPIITDRVYLDACLVSINILKRVAAESNAEKRSDLMKILVKICFQCQNDDVYKAALWCLSELLVECESKELFIASFLQLLDFPANLELKLSEAQEQFIQSAVVPFLFNPKDDDDEERAIPTYAQVKAGRSSFLTSVVVQIARKLCYLLDFKSPLVAKILVGASALTKKTEFMSSDRQIAMNGIHDMYTYLQSGVKNVSQITEVVHNQQKVEQKQQRRTDEALEFSLFGCAAPVETKTVVKSKKRLSPYEHLAANPSLIHNIFQLSADADLIYAEALVVTNKTQIILNVLFVNRTNVTIEELELELFTSSSLKSSSQVKKLAIEPNGQLIQQYELSISSCSSAVIFGNLCARFQQNAKERHKDVVMRIREIQFDISQFIQPTTLNLQLWEVELLFLVYYVSNYILKYFATSNADDKFQQIISSWRLFMNYSLTQEGQKYDFDRIRPQSTIQSRYLIFQKGKIEITTCNKRTAMTKINAVEDVQGRSTNSLNKLRQF